MIGWAMAHLAHLSKPALTGELLKIQGEAQVTVCCKDQKVKLSLIVA